MDNQTIAKLLKEAYEKFMTVSVLEEMMDKSRMSSSKLVQSKWTSLAISKSKAVKEFGKVSSKISLWDLDFNFNDLLMNSRGRFVVKLPLDIFGDKQVFGFKADFWEFLFPEISFGTVAEDVLVVTLDTDILLSEIPELYSLAYMKFLECENSGILDPFKSEEVEEKFKTIQDLINEN